MAPPRSLEGHRKPRSMRAKPQGAVRSEVAGEMVMATFGTLRIKTCLRSRSGSMPMSRRRSPRSAGVVRATAAPTKLPLPKMICPPVIQPPTPERHQSRRLVQSAANSKAMKPLLPTMSPPTSTRQPLDVTKAAAHKSMRVHFLPMKMSTWSHDAVNPPSASRHPLPSEGRGARRRGGQAFSSNARGSTSTAGKRTKSILWIFDLCTCPQRMHLPSLSPTRLTVFSSVNLTTMWQHLDVCSLILKAHSVLANCSVHSLAQPRTAKVIRTAQHYMPLFPASIHHSRERQAYGCNTGHDRNDTNSAAPRPIWNTEWELSSYTGTTPPVACVPKYHFRPRPTWAALGSSVQCRLYATCTVLFDSSASMCTS